MAEKEITNIVKLQIEAGKATPAPPVGPALGSTGINIMQFTKEFNEKTANQPGMIIPVVITVYSDKSFTFITKVPPVAVLIKKAIKLEKGSGKPNKDKVATITKEQVKDIRENETLCETYPGTWFVKNKTPIEYTIISSTKTKLTMETGVDDDVDLFK